MKKLTLFLGALMIAGASFACDGGKKGDKACCKKTEQKACCKKGDKKDCAKTAEAKKAEKKAEKKS